MTRIWEWSGIKCYGMRFCQPGHKRNQNYAIWLSAEEALSIVAAADQPRQWQRPRSSASSQRFVNSVHMKPRSTAINYVIGPS